MTERITHEEDGSIDEVVTNGGAHLERMTGTGWFLRCIRADGSELCLWVEGRITLTEERPAMECKACRHPLGANPAVTEAGYLLCGACLFTQDPAWSASGAKP